MALKKIIKLKDKKNKETTTKKKTDGEEEEDNNNNNNNNRREQLQEQQEQQPSTSYSSSPKPQPHSRSISIVKNNNEHDTNNQLAASFASRLSTSSPAQQRKDPETDLTTEEKDRLITRHLVTQQNTAANAEERNDDALFFGDTNDLSDDLPLSQDNNDETTSQSPPRIASSGRPSGSSTAPSIPILNAKPRDLNVDSSDEIFSTSHKLVGGAIVRDIYKWHEDQADTAGRKRSKSQSDIHIAAADLGVGVEGDLTRDPAESPLDGTFSYQNGTFPAQQRVTASQMRVPGGFRRHFVHRRARREGRAPKRVTRDFIDFLALYGHFAGDDLHDEDDMSDNDDDFNLPYVEPGLPPVPRPLSERAPLLPSRRTPDSEAGTASNKKVVFLLLKSFIGTGVLFLPRSFYNGGMLFSIIVLGFISWLCLYSMILLVKCRSVVRGSFGDIGGELYGPHMRTVVLSSIAFSQVGFCCAYFIFVAQNMRDLVANVTNCRVNLPNHYYIFAQLAFYIPTVMVRKIHKLGFLALVADVFILIGLAYLYNYDFQILSTVGVAPLRHFNSGTVSLFIGTAIFTFEGIGLVIPIAESMKEPEKFPKVLSWTMAFVTVVFVSAGALSYAAFGDAVETVVLLNLPAKDPLVHVVQLLYSFAIMFSVPLMLYPAIRIIEAGIWVRTGKSSLAVKWQKNIFRATLCIFASAVSWAGSSNLDRFVALSGAFACVPLSFIYPAMFHYKALAHTRTEKAKDIALFIFGFICMFYVGFQTLQSWIADDPEPPLDRCAP